MRPIFTFASDILAAWCPGVQCWHLCAPAGVLAGFVMSPGVLAPGCGDGAVVTGAGSRSWWRPVKVARWPGWRGSCGAVAGFSGAGPGRRGAGFLLAGRAMLPRIRWLRTISRVAVNSMRGARPMRRHQPRADVVCGGVLDGGEAAFGAGAAGVGAAPRGGGVVVFLPGLRVHVRRDGDGLLGAAGLRVLRKGEDLGMIPVQASSMAGRSGQRILPMVAGQATRW